MGGGFAIPRAFNRALRRAGGELRLKTPVKRILLDGKRAAGVELEDGTQISARYVLSNADPGVTFGKLIGMDQLSARLRGKISRARYSTSCLSLYFATDMDLRGEGLDSGNMWYYDHADVDRIYSDGLTDALLRDETPPGMFLTVTTLKDPSKMHSGHHTCESFAFVGYQAFEKWAHTKYGSRPADYDAMKEDLAWRMVRGPPGFSSSYSPASRCSTKRCRQVPTVALLQRRRRAMMLLLAPSADHSTSLARATRAWGRLREPAHASSCTCSSEVRLRGGLGRPVIMPQLNPSPLVMPVTYGTQH